MRRFWRFYFFQLVLGIVVLQLAYFAWLQYRNHLPISNRDTSIVVQGRDVTIYPLRNDKDEDRDDEIFLAGFSNPIHGSIRQVKNKLIYSSPEDFIGKDSLWYTVSDSTDESDRTYISIEVIENKPPKAVNDTVTIFPFETPIIYPLTNDTDDEEGMMEIINITSTKNSGNELSSDRKSFIYYLTKSSIKQDILTYAVSDGKNTEKATVVVNINYPKYTRFSNISGFGLLSDFEFVKSSRWEIVKERQQFRLGLVSNDHGTNGNRIIGERAIVRNRIFDDFILNVNAKTLERVDLEGYASFAIIFSYQDQDNYCYAMLGVRKEGYGATGIYQIKDGNMQANDWSGVAIPDDKFHHYTLERKGNIVMLKRDSQEIIKVDRPEYRAVGKIGLGSIAKHRVLFDDLKVIKL